MNRWISPSTALRAPSTPLGEKDGMRGFGSWSAPTAFWPRIGTLNLVVFCCLLHCFTARAVLFLSTADPEFNTTAPGGDLANSGWDLQGFWGGFLGTPIAPRYFICGQHFFGGLPGDKFLLGGTEYTTVAFFDDPESDLRIWKIRETFPAFAGLYSRDDELGKPLVVFGRGTQRGSELVVDGASGSPFKGWYWGVGDSRLRWGENRVGGILVDDRTGSSQGLDPSPRLGSLLKVFFSASPNVNQAHLSGGDSGGGVFIKEGAGWKLAGINYGVDGPYNTSTNGPGFQAAVVDERGLYKGGEGHWRALPGYPVNVPGAFYATRISFRLNWINSVLAQPDTIVPPLLQSAVKVSGPFQSQSVVKVDEPARTMTVPQPAGVRFYRISAPIETRITGLRIVGGNLIFTYR
jgi:hypothetical protein